MSMQDDTELTKAPDQTPSRARHQYPFVVPSLAAACLALLVAIGVFHQIHSKGHAANTAKKVKSSQVITNKSTYKTLLGFQPLLPTYKPASTVSKTIQVLLFNRMVTQYHNASHPLNVRQFRLTLWQSGHYRYIVIDEAPLTSIDIQQVNPDHLGYPATTVTVNSVRFDEAKMPQAELYLLKNGVFYGVWGANESQSELAKLLISLKTPATGTPEQLKRVSLSSNAAKMIPFQVDLPTYLPKGYTPFGEPFAEIETTQYGKGTFVEFQKAYGIGYNPNQIVIIEVVDKNSGIKDSFPADEHSESINGQTVYYSSENRQYDWIDGHTGVHFTVAGGSGNAAAQHLMLKQVVSSMIH